MEYRTAFLDIFEKSGWKDVSVKRGGVAQLAEPHIVSNGEDEGRGSADACDVEGVILDMDLPDSLYFLGLVDGIH